MFFQRYDVIMHGTFFQFIVYRYYVQAYVVPIRGVDATDDGRYGLSELA